MADHQVAKRYAEALFNVAKKNDVVASVESDLEAISYLFNRDDKFRDFLYNPEVDRGEKLGLAVKVFSDRVTALTMSLLRLLLEKRREHELEGIHHQFSTLRRADEKTTFVTIHSAEELDTDQKKALIQKAEAITGGKVDSEFLIEPELIGGVKLSYGNFVLDGTVRGNLNKLGDKLRFDLFKN